MKGKRGIGADSLFAEGRGFTLSEIKLAGIPKKQAKGLGIVVDHRRRSKSEEGQKLNVERLKEYRSRLVVFPRKAGKPKSGDATVSGAMFHGAGGAHRARHCCVSVESSQRRLIATDTRCRATTSPPTSPAPFPPSPPLTRPRLPVPSPRRRRRSTPSPPFVSPALPRGTRARGRRGPRPRRPRRLPSRSRWHHRMAAGGVRGSWAGRVHFLCGGYAPHDRTGLRATCWVLGAIAVLMRVDHCQWCCS